MTSHSWEVVKPTNLYDATSVVTVYKCVNCGLKHFESLDNPSTYNKPATSCEPDQAVYNKIAARYFERSHNEPVK